ncbi:oligosaccharide flippase family protein [Myceligenerans indicum]|uniref:Oligosaccharide flippase family protein n=1 Tax=Myceligenerans indicum TaxID=2593663 RepID=A0ABS1LN78_9MICO|nr:oligosaccharide flippase family protein [Myceligenerans indicum]MBL0887539.1 oligosaccharide flippase family protein [Myceligenerans indicum]
MTQASLARIGARGGAVTLLGQVLMVAVRMGALIVLARLIDPGTFGLVAIVAAISTFAVSVVLFGLPMAVAQAETLSRPAKSTLFLVNVGLGLLLGAALFLSGGWLARAYGDERLVGVAHWLALIPVLIGLATQSRAQLMRSLRFTTLFFAEVVALVVGTGAAVFLAVRGAGLEAVLTQQLAPVALQVVLVVVGGRWLPGRPGALAEVRSLLAVGLRILGMNVLKNGSRQVIVPVMGLSVPAAALGNFDRAQQLIVTPINLTVDRMQQVVVPVLSKLRGRPARMRAYAQRALLLGAYGTATVFLLLAVLGRPLVRVVLGPGWETAGVVIQILALGATCRVLGQTMQWIFIAAGATRQGLRFNLWTQPLVVAVSLAGLPFGVLGVAVMNSVAWALFWPVATVAAARAAGFPAGSFFVGPARAICLFGIPVAAVAALPLLLGLSDGVTVVLGLVLGGCAGALSRLLFRTVRSDLDALVSTARLALARRTSPASARPERTHGANLHERD